MLAGWYCSSIVLREYRSRLTCHNRGAGDAILAMDRV